VNRGVKMSSTSGVIREGGKERETKTSREDLSACFPQLPGWRKEPGISKAHFLELAKRGVRRMGKGAHLEDQMNNVCRQPQ